MQPLIDGPAFQRALNELATTARLAPAEFQQFSPAQARQAFLAGTCALALTWPSAIPPTDVVTHVASNDSDDLQRGGLWQAGRTCGAKQPHELMLAATPVVAATGPLVSLRDLEQREPLEPRAPLVGTQIAFVLPRNPALKSFLLNRMSNERWSWKATSFLESQLGGKLQSSLFKLQPLHVAASQPATALKLISTADETCQSERRSETFVSQRTNANAAETGASNPESSASAPSAAEPAAVAVRKVGFLPLPGSLDFYDTRSQAWLPRPEDQPRQVSLLATSGRLGSLTRWGKRSAAAQTLLAWLGTAEAGSELGPASGATTLFRQSQITTASRWVDHGLPTQTAQEYAELVANTQRGIAWLAAPRIPGRNRYLAALDQAVQKVISGQATSQAALAEAAKTWDAITTELGRDAQRDAYSRSLGLETSPTVTSRP